MSAIISLPSGQAAAAAKFALDGGGETDLSPAGGLGPFAALFRNLVDKQIAVDAAPGLPLALPEADPATTGAADDLEAFLPFLDAMGLAQEAAPPLAADDGATGLAEEVMPADMPENILAIATPPGEADTPENALAIATPPGDGDDTPAISAVAATDAKGTPSRPGSPGAPDADFAEPVSHAAPAIVTPDRALSRGREFSTQLVAAIENSKEQPHTPGSTATAVQQIIAATAPQHAQAARAPLPVAQPVGSSGWGEEVGNRIAWMVTRMESRAELVLTPPQMGRVEVSLSVTGDQASATFVSANPTVREALEAALPRLREILAESGIQLGQAQVGAENARQSAQQDKNGDNSGASRTGGVLAAPSKAEGEGTMSSVGLKTGRGLVDVFA